MKRLLIVCLLAALFIGVAAYVMGPQAAAQDGDRPRETDAPRDGDRPRETDAPRDGDRPRETDAPRDGDRPRETDSPRDGDRPRETDAPRDGDRPRETDAPRDGDRPRETDAPRDGDRPRETDSPRDGDRPRETDAPRDGDRPRETDAPRDGDRPNPERIAAELREIRANMGELERAAHAAREAGNEGGLAELRAKMEQLQKAVAEREAYLRRVSSARDVPREGDTPREGDRPNPERIAAELRELQAEMGELERAAHVAREQENEGQLAEIHDRMERIHGGIVERENYLRRLHSDREVPREGDRPQEGNRPNPERLGPSIERIQAQMEEVEAAAHHAREAGNEEEFSQLRRRMEELARIRQTMIARVEGSERDAPREGDRPREEGVRPHPEAIERAEVELRDMMERFEQLQGHAAELREEGRGDAAEAAMRELNGMEEVIAQRRQAIERAEDQLLAAQERERGGEEARERELAQNRERESAAAREREERGDDVLREIGGLLRELREEVGALRGEVEELRGQVDDLREEER
jgi:hypothetical protein